MKQSSLHQDKSTNPGTFNRWVLLSCLVLLAVAVGFHFGQRVPVSPFTIAGQFARADDGQSEDLALGPDSHSLPLENYKPLPSVPPAVIDSVTSAQDFSIINKERKYRVEIEYLSSTARKLRKRVASLEWETLTLESDLLASEVELGKALGQLVENKQQRRDVYNITNVPVGGFVAPALMIKDAVHAPQRSEVASLASPVLDSLQADDPEEMQEHDEESNHQQPLQQSVFYGPGPDRYDDLVDPDFPLTPFQDQTQDGNLRNSGG